MKIMVSIYANDRYSILYFCVYIIAQLIASTEQVSSEARHYLVMEKVIHVMHLCWN